MEFINTINNNSLLIIPDNITSVGGCAFYGCSNLEHVSIPKNTLDFEYSVGNDTFVEYEPVLKQLIRASELFKFII